MRSAVDTTPVAQAGAATAFAAIELNFPRKSPQCP